MGKMEEDGSVRVFQFGFFKKGDRIRELFHLQIK